MRERGGRGGGGGGGGEGRERWVERGGWGTEQTLLTHKYLKTTQTHSDNLTA